MKTVEKLPTRLMSPKKSPSRDCSETKHEVEKARKTEKNRENKRNTQENGVSNHGWHRMSCSPYRQAKKTCVCRYSHRRCSSSPALYNVPKT